MPLPLRQQTITGSLWIMHLEINAEDCSSVEIGANVRVRVRVRVKVRERVRVRKRVEV